MRAGMCAGGDTPGWHTVLCARAHGGHDVAVTDPGAVVRRYRKRPEVEVAEAVYGTGTYDAEAVWPS